MMNRRSWLAASGAAALSASVRFRLAICSETFPGASFFGICQSARRTGYTGLEIDPSNLSSDPASLGAAERRSLSNQMKVNGLHYCGLHSFLKAPSGLHLTTPDATVRTRTWEYFARLIDLAADLGPSPVMVLGSSKQRQAIDGATPADAAKRLAEGLSKVAPQAARRGLTILVEPLAPHLCNVVNTMAEAIAIGNAAHLNRDFFAINNAVPHGHCRGPLTDNGALAAHPGKKNLNEALGFVNHFNVMPILAQPHLALS